MHCSQLRLAGALLIIFFSLQILGKAIERTNLNIYTTFHDYFSKCQALISRFVLIILFK